MPQFGIILLRRRILRCAQTANHRGGFGTARIIDLDQAEVHQKNLALWRDTHVRRFDVAMHQAVMVNVLQGQQQLIGPTEDRELIEAARLQGHERIE